MMPDRIQLSRAKGWRMPPNTVKVDRSTKWGNPCMVAALREAGFGEDDNARAQICAEAFRDWLSGKDQDWIGPASDERRAMILCNLPDLRGKNLACWCKPGSPCHADVLLEIANA